VEHARAVAARHTSVRSAAAAWPCRLAGDLAGRM